MQLTKEYPFLQACRRKPAPFTPIWLMRQAGRYMAEYRAVRERLGFLELCHHPEAAAEVTVTAVERLGVDAAIVFADILLILEPLDVGLHFGSGDGPQLQRPVQHPEDVARLHAYDAADALAFVYDTVRRARRYRKSTRLNSSHLGISYAVLSTLTLFPYTTLFRSSTPRSCSPISS